VFLFLDTVVLVMWFGSFQFFLDFRSSGSEKVRYEYQNLSRFLHIYICHKEK